ALIGAIANITLDRNSNPIFSDPGNSVVLRLNPDATVTVLAGNGIQGFSGDGGPATSAALNMPQGVAYDSRGNLYIADSGNNRVGMVTPGGVIPTLAGNGQFKYAGDGGPAVNASLTSPLALAIDSNNALYIDDLPSTPSGAAARIRRVTPDGIISTWAGNG